MSDLAYTGRTRTVAALLGILTWAGLVVQLVLAIQSTGILVGLSVSLRYFTVLTNLGVALALTVPLVAPESAVGRFCRRAGTLTGLAASIALVGLVYVLLLRQPWDTLAVAFADLVLHYLTPVLFVAFWWYAGPKARLSWRQIPWWCAYPLAYFLYVLVRGELGGIYPYPFLDVGQFGHAAVWRNAIVLLVVFVAISLCLVAVSRIASRA